MTPEQQTDRTGPLTATTGLSTATKGVGMTSQQSPVGQHCPDGSAYCSDPDCPYCRELRAAAELAQAGKNFRLVLVRSKKSVMKAPDKKLPA